MYLRDGRILLGVPPMTEPAYKIESYGSRREWLELRRSGLGASDVAAVVGESPWATPLQVWMSKVEDDAPEAETNEDMEWGLRMERLILDETCARLGADPALYAPLLRSAERSWMMATPDLLATTDGISVVIEAKKVDAWPWDEIPPQYMYQVQWQLAVAGYEVAYLAALHRGRRLELYMVERDEEVIGRLVEAGGRFWESVEAVEPPPVSAADNEYLGDLWPDSVDSAAEIPEDLAEELAAAKAASKEAKERLDLVSARVKEAMGHADTAVVGDRVVATWRTSTSRRLDTKLLRAEEPDLADTYTKESSSRRFLIKDG